jgi:hypothetical protein
MSDAAIPLAKRIRAREGKELKIPPLEKTEAERVLRIPSTLIMELALF